MFTGRYINLDRSPDRLAFVEAEITKLGLSERYRRFAAMDGATVSAAPWHAQRNEVGCYVSHMAVIAEHSGEDWLHVIEDDVYFSRRFPQIAELLTSDPAYADIDILFTNIRFPDDTLISSEFRAVFDRCVETDEIGNVTRLKSLATPALAGVAFCSATSYLVNPRSARKVAGLLADRLGQEPFAGLDTALMLFAWDGRLSCACTVPFFTMSRFDIPSTITGPRPWATGHRLRELSLFADRDVAQIRVDAARLHREAGGSVTAELMGEAHKYIVQVSGDRRFQERAL